MRRRPCRRCRRRRRPVTPSGPVGERGRPKQRPRNTAHGPYLQTRWVNWACMGPWYRQPGLACRRGQGQPWLHLFNRELWGSGSSDPEYVEPRKTHQGRRHGQTAPRTRGKDVVALGTKGRGCAGLLPLARP